MSADLKSVDADLRSADAKFVNANLMSADAKFVDATLMSVEYLSRIYIDIIKPQTSDLPTFQNGG